MYKKKDFEFITKYEKLKYKSGTIHCTPTWIHIITDVLIESHKIETDCIKEQYFTLDSFLREYKKIHGSRHLFTIIDDGLLLHTKKDGDEIVYPLEHGLCIPSLTIKKRGSIIDNLSYKQFNLLNDISLDISYLCFLKDATLVLEKEKSYIWKTNGITDIYIQLPRYDVKRGYKVPKEISYLSSISQWEDREVFFTIEKKVSGIGSDYFVIYSNNNMMAIPICQQEEYDTYEIPSYSQQYTLTQKELKSLQSIKFKKLIAELKKEKNIKIGYEVYIEIIDGIWYMNDKKFFECSGKITTRRFEAYKLASFIQNANQLTITENFIQDSHTLFI